MEKSKELRNLKEDFGDVDFMVYSKLLQKPFNNIQELREAEKAYKLEERKKQEAKLARKQEASKVEEAFKEFNVAKKAYNETVSEAKKKYATTISKAKSELAEVIKTESEKLEKTEDTYNKTLDEFTKTHPEGYHLTLKDGDNVTTISRSGDIDFFKDFSFDKFFDNFFNFKF